MIIHNNNLKEKICSLKTIIIIAGILTTLLILLSIAYFMYSFLVFCGVPLGVMGYEQLNEYVGENEEQLSYLIEYIDELYVKENVDDSITIRTDTPDIYYIGIYEKTINNTTIVGYIEQLKKDDFDVITIYDDYVQISNWSDLDSNSGILYSFEEDPDAIFDRLTKLTYDNWYYYKEIS